MVAKVDDMQCLVRRPIGDGELIARVVDVDMYQSKAYNAVRRTSYCPLNTLWGQGLAKAEKHATNLKFDYLRL